VRQTTGRKSGQKAAEKPHQNGLKNGIKRGEKVLNMREKRDKTPENTSKTLVFSIQKVLLGTPGGARRVRCGRNVSLRNF
jgi:hypothetical protein